MMLGSYLMNADSPTRCNNKKPNTNKEQKQ